MIPNAISEMQVFSQVIKTSAIPLLFANMTFIEKQYEIWIISTAFVVFLLEEDLDFRPNAFSIIYCHFSLSCQINGVVRHNFLHVLEQGY